MGGGGEGGGGVGGGGAGGGDRTVHEPSSTLALESKLNAVGAMQPGTSYLCVNVGGARGSVEGSS